MTQKDHSLDRKALKRPDEFVKRGRAFFENFTENSTLVLVLCGVLVVLAIVIGAIDHFHFKSEMEARTALYQAKTQIQAEVRDSLTESDREDSKETNCTNGEGGNGLKTMVWIAIFGFDLVHRFVQSPFGIFPDGIDYPDPINHFGHKAAARYYRGVRI